MDNIRTLQGDLIARDLRDADDALVDGDLQPLLQQVAQRERELQEAAASAGDPLAPRPEKKTA